MTGVASWENNFFSKSSILGENSGNDTAIFFSSPWIRNLGIQPWVNHKTKSLQACSIDNGGNMPSALDNQPEDFLLQVYRLCKPSSASDITKGFQWVTAHSPQVVFFCTLTSSFGNQWDCSGNTHTVSDHWVEKQQQPWSGPDYWHIGDSSTSGVGSVCVEISDMHQWNKQKVKLSFGLGELVRQTNGVVQHI